MTPSHADVALLDALPEALLDLARRLEERHWGGPALGWTVDQEVCEEAAAEIRRLRVERDATQYEEECEVNATQYQILVHANVAGLGRLVNEAIGNGWQPLGGPTYGKWVNVQGEPHFVWAQAVRRDLPQTEEAK